MAPGASCREADQGRRLILRVCGLSVAVQQRLCCEISVKSETHCGELIFPIETRETCPNGERNEPVAHDAVTSDPPVASMERAHGKCVMHAHT